MRNGDGIDAVAHLFEHLAEVLILRGTLEAGTSDSLVELQLVDIANRHDVAMTGGITRVAATLAVDADTGVTNAGVGRAIITERNPTADKHGSRQSRRGL